MNKYLYDTKTNSFYPLALKTTYENAGMWPEEGIEVDEELFSQFQNVPVGKNRVAGNDGLPVWADAPPPSREQIISSAGSQRESLINIAKNMIAPLQDAVDLEEATESEEANLKLWKKYRVELNRIDINLAPDIKWPVAPSI